jgi:hypothetical protein
MSTTVRHDPFARGALQRFCFANTHPAHRLACAWCGQQPARLYTYLWWSDGHMAPRVSGSGPDTFCNLACHDAYAS